MPFSDNRFDKQVLDFISAHPSKKYLDIGAGSGKYARMIRKAVKNPEIIAVEPDGGYIKEYELERLYDTVINKSAEQLIDDEADLTADIAIIGDCIEHLRKSVGLDLIHYLVYRTRYIIVVYPVKYIQYSWKGRDQEAHRSVWSGTDFNHFDFQQYKKDFMRLVIVKGYIDDPEAQYPVEK